jgi:hypothetical protein
VSNPGGKPGLHLVVFYDKRFARERSAGMLPGWRLQAVNVLLIKVRASCLGSYFNIRSGDSGFSSAIPMNILPLYGLIFYPSTPVMP